MSLTFHVRADVSAVKAKLGRLKAEIEQKVTVQAINRTAATVRSQVVKKLSEESGLQQKVIREKVYLRKAQRGRNAYMYAVVGASRYSVNLIEMVKPGQRKTNYFNKRLGKGKNMRFRSSGVVAQAWGKSKTYKGTFIGTSGNGELRVYARISKDRTRLKLISGPSLRNEFKRPEMQTFMRSIAAERFPIEFSYAFKHAMSNNK